MDYQKNSAGVRTCFLMSIAFSLGVAACSGPAAPRAPTTVVAATEAPSKPPPTHVRVGLAAPGTGGANMAGAGEYLAQAQGYFADEGLAIDFVQVNAGNALPPLMAGQIDIAVDGLGSAFFNAIQQGLDVHIAGPAARSEPSANGYLFIVRKDLVDGGRLREYADLRGLKIAIPAHGNSGEYAVATAMAAGGLTLADADIVLLDFPAMLTALASKAIDVAGALPEPLASIAVQNGSGVKWRQATDLLPDQQGTVVVFSSQFAAQRDIATHWMIAYLRGMRDFNDAFVKNVHRQQTTEALAAALSIDPKLFNSMALPHLDPDGKVNVASIEAQMGWYVKMGYLSAPITMSRVVDASFAETAVAQLGPYQ